MASRRGISGPTLPCDDRAVTTDLAWLRSDAPLERPPAPDLPADPTPLVLGETAAARLVLLEREEAAYRARHGFDGPDFAFCGGHLTAWSPSTRLWLAARAAPLGWDDVRDGDRPMVADIGRTTTPR